MTCHPAFSVRGVLAALFWLTLLAPASPVLADGKYYARETKVGPGIPYQRALVAFNGEREILVVQSRYENRGEQPLREIGWIVPLPAVPRVGTMEPYQAERTFRNLGMRSSVQHVSIFGELVGWLGIAVFVGFGVVALRLAVSIAMIALKITPDRRIGTPRSNLKWLGMLFLAILLMAIAIPQFSGRGTVDVVKAETVGGLDIKVVKSGSSAALLEWFTENGLKYDPADVAAIERHVAKGWVFVTARASATASASEILGRHGMLAPLVLVFPTRQAVYPLALTATAGQTTTVDLFVFQSGKADASGRLPLKFAGRGESASRVVANVVPPELLENENISEDYLTRFRGEMTAEQMKDDLILVPAADNVPVKLTEYRW